MGDGRVTHCPRCHAELSDWEVQEAAWHNSPPCWCSGVPLGVRPTLANVAYAKLCDQDLRQPVKTHDVARFVTPEYGGDPRYSISGALSQGMRFCWGGRALYGLARHGLVPGARSLPEAAYAILIAAPRELHVEEVDFVLEQLNYRFNSDSLLHHLRGYTSNRWGLQFNIDYRNRVWVDSGRDSRQGYNRHTRVCPSETGFDDWIDNTLAPKVERTLADRAHRLASLSGIQLALAGDRVEFR
jgi:hypothetical protein